MRLFVALELPDRLRAAVAERIEAEREQLPPASWVRAQNLHLTLLFLGDVADAESAVRAFGAAELPRPSAAVTIGGAGGFPDRGPIRVVWLGLEPAAELATLAGALRAAARVAELPFDPKPFHPHLTLARCRRPWPSALRGELGRLEPAPGPAFAAERATLMSSVLGAGGSTYAPVAELALREGA